jgi:uncharacterized protein (TIGR00255 family)
MTGFGRGTVKLKKGVLNAEIKTVNHKFFDETLKLPNGIAAFEDKVKEVLQKKIRRGKVNLNLICEGKLLKPDKISINIEAAKNYYNQLSKLNKSLGVKDDITTKDLMLLPGVLSHEQMDEGLLKFWPSIKQVIDKALDSLNKDREKEGRSIYVDLKKRAGKINSMVSVIKARSHLNIGEYRKRFADRVKDITGGRDIDMGRLEMEVAIFAKNSDISEEVTRLKNHLINFDKTISGNGEVGKKLDFIAQELHREINTIGSKASDFKISKNVIEIKGEIEKIREQAKNLE